MTPLNDTNDECFQISNSAVASGGDCVIGLNAVADQRHTFDYVAGSYYAAPTANSTITIHDATNNTDLFGPLAVTQSGPFMFPFGVRGIQAPLGAAVNIVLSDGGQIKSLSTQYR